MVGDSGRQSQRAGHVTAEVPEPVGQKGMSDRRPMPLHVDGDKMGSIDKLEPALPE